MNVQATQKWRVPLLLLSAAIALVAVFALSTLPRAFAGTGTSQEDAVETWAELKYAIENNPNNLDTIYISGTLGANESITVSRDVTILGNGTIARDQDASSQNFTDFVVNGGNLKLGNSVTLTGQQASCNGGGTGGGSGATEPGTNSSFFTAVYAFGGYIHSTSSSAAQSDNFEFYELDDATNTWSKATTFTVGKKYSFTAAAENGNGVFGIEHADSEREFSGVYGNYGDNACRYEQSRKANGLKPSDDYDKGYIWEAVAGANGGFTLRNFANNSKYLSADNNGLTIEDFSTEFAYGKVNVQNADGTTSEVGPVLYSNPQPLTPPQGCDTPGCAEYTNDTFGSGDATTPKGFFVQVENGTLTIQGNATLSDFITDGSVRHAAPVVVNGTNAKLVMEGGKISGNSVGYMADHNLGNSPAHDIGKEDETGSFNYNGAMAGWTKTETAGAIIVNGGARADINSGDITSNRGDTGGILVQGLGNETGKVNGEGNSTNMNPGVTSKLALNGGTVSDNFGEHHGGGVTIFNGAAAQMEDGAKISGNFSWHKGGGVFVSDEVFASMGPVKEDGKSSVEAGKTSFLMNGGTISNNHAIHRGGGIEVASNGVALLDGEISGNTSRTLGGGIYVEGDAGRMYQLYIANGCVTANTATGVSSTLNASIPDTSNGVCGIGNSLEVANGGGLGYQDGFWGEKGDGSGLWLCPLGGNGTLALMNGYNVKISGNTAANGTDIYVTKPRAGVGNGINIIGLNGQVFTDQYGNELTPNTTYAGEIKLENADSSQGCPGGIEIRNNRAINGGGIAANGTVVFGSPEDTYRAATQLDVTKTWGETATQENIWIKLNAKVGTETVELGQAFLNGVADTAVGGQTGDGLTQENNYYSEATAAYEASPWVARFGFPLVVTLPNGGGQYPLFKVEVNGQELDPSKISDLEQIYAAANNGTVTLVPTSWQLEIVETKDDGTTELKPTTIDPVALVGTVGKVDAETNYYDIDGNPILPAPIGTYTTAFEFGQGLTNDGPEEPEIEKYVNDKVHADVDLDEEFTYSIFAYVTKDADKVTITDELVGDLQFAFATGDAATKVKVEDWGEGKKGNPPAATAEKGANAIDSVVATKAVSGQTLTVTITNELEEVKDADGKVTGVANTDNNQNVTPLRGHWVKITFDAKYAENKKVADVEANYVSVDETAANEDRATPNVGNDPTGVKGSHEGTANTASYDIEVGNKSEYSDESNTVTVKPNEPEKPEIEKYVNEVKPHADLNAYDEVFRYDVVMYAPKDATILKMTDTLDELLELVVDGDHPVTASVADKAGIQADRKDLDSADTFDHTGKNSGSSIEAAIGSDATNAPVLKCAGKYVTVTFYAKIKASVTPEQLANAYEDKKVPNKASYIVNNDNDYGAESNTVTVTPQETKLVVTKIWKEGGSVITWPDGATVTVKLQQTKDGKTTDVAGKTATLDAKNTSATFANLPVLEGVTYSAVETEVKGATGFTTDAGKATGNAKDGFEQTITNTKPAPGTEEPEEPKPENPDKEDPEEPGGTTPTGPVTPGNDEPTKHEIIISKVDMTDGAGSELPGAHIKIYDADGNVVDEWISTTEPHKLYLEAGTYTFEEVNAPEGFQAITTTVTFEVDDKGNVKLVGAYEDINGKVEVKDLNHLILSDLPEDKPVAPKPDGSSETNDDGTGGRDNSNTGDNKNQNGGSEEDDGTGRNLSQSPNTTRTPGSVSASPTTSTTRSATATARPTTSTVVRGLSQTADDLGPAIYGLAALAILAFGAGAVSLRRNRKEDQ